jgi:hypothetical protein
MRVDVFGPCLLVEDVPASARLYVERFGFTPRLETVPEGYRARHAAGLIIGLLKAAATPGLCGSGTSPCGRRVRPSGRRAAR